MRTSRDEDNRRWPHYMCFSNEATKKQTTTDLPDRRVGDACLHGIRKSVPCPENRNHAYVAFVDKDARERRCGGCRNELPAGLEACDTLQKHG